MAFIYFALGGCVMRGGRVVYIQLPGIFEFAALATLSRGARLLSGRIVFLKKRITKIIIQP